MTQSNMLQNRQNEAKNEAIQMLKLYGRCAILRPTGFGKTTLMSQIIATSNYKSVLYVYPTDSVKDTAEDKMVQFKVDLSMVKFVSYTKLSRDNGRLSDKYNPAQNYYDLIIFDEIHHMGAAQAKESIKQLLSLVDTNKTHIIGATATPVRMDSFDVIDEFFDNCVITYYGMDNAIEDGIIPKPHYVYASLSLKETKFLRSKGVHKLDPLLFKDLKTELRTLKGRLNQVMNASVILKAGVKKAFKDKTPPYMKFIIFCSDVAILTKKRPEVVEWFQKAFPEYAVESIDVHSRDNKSRNLKRLDNLVPAPNKIDLIFNVNMLNEGAHLENLTGVVMLRPTRSHAIYTQQAGRCLQVGMSYTPVIFDFVDNVSIGSLFETAKNNNKNSSTPATLAEQMAKLNNIATENVHILDQVKHINDILAKIENAMPSDTELEVLERRKNQMPATVIADELHVTVWDVFRILEKHDKALTGLKLQKQERDFWEKGDIGDKMKRGNKRVV